MVKERAYLGIDPGEKGFLALQCEGKFEFYSIKDNDVYKLSDILNDISNRYPNLVCVMEQVHALFGSSAKSTFTFGEINGILKGLLCANKIPYHLVQPKLWQKEMWSNKDLVLNFKKITIKEREIIRKEVNTKQTSINAARRLFPDIDFRRTKKCTNLDDNKVDATLMSEYARRKNL